MDTQPEFVPIVNNAPDLDKNVESIHHHKLQHEDCLLDCIPADVSHVTRDVRWLLKQCNAPVKRTESGYHTVRLENRIVQATIPAHNCLARPTVVTGKGEAVREYAIFSVFAQYYLDFKAILKTDDKINTKLWSCYPIRWRDSWKPPVVPGTEYLYEGVDRSMLVIDEFTAYLCGMSDKTYMLTDQYEVEYNAESGLPVVISFRVYTGGLDDALYATYRKNMRIYATNGFAAALASFERGQELLLKNKERQQNALMGNLLSDYVAIQNQLAENMKRMRQQRTELMNAAEKHRQIKNENANHGMENKTEENEGNDMVADNVLELIPLEEIAPIAALD